MKSRCFYGLQVACSSLFSCISPLSSLPLQSLSIKYFLTSMAWRESQIPETLTVFQMGAKGGCQRCLCGDGDIYAGTRRPYHWFMEGWEDRMHKVKIPAQGAEGMITRFLLGSSIMNGQSFPLAPGEVALHSVYSWIRFFEDRRSGTVPFLHRRIGEGYANCVARL